MALWVNKFLGLDGADSLSKLKVVRICRWVADQYDVEDRTTAISEEEMIEQIRTHLPDLYEERVRPRLEGR